MRPTHSALLVAALVAAAAPAAARAQAAAQPPAKQQAEKTMTAEELDARVRAELQKIKTRLKLTQEQEVQLRNLMRDEVERLDAMMYRYEGEARTLITDSRAKMRNVLDPKQQAEWDKIKHEYREQFRARAEQKPTKGT